MFKLPHSFNIPPIPTTIFAPGSLASLVGEIQRFGTHVLIITGGSSFTSGAHWNKLQQDLRTANIHWDIEHIQGEPSTQIVDHIVSIYHTQPIDVVVGIGGGSPLDAAKAVAGLLPHGNSVMDHIEGVGRGIPYPGHATPLIAVPTTAGTGSEATKNAVLSYHDPEHGFKKSFRAEALIANTAIIDPNLLKTCPRHLIAANGMDAFVQLLESYVSRQSHPVSDALAWSGIEAFHHSFMSVMQGEQSNAHLSNLAYASYISGITLAQVGLGSIHALASPIGAFSLMPHGEVCGTLLAVATEQNIHYLQERQDNPAALQKYLRVAHLFHPDTAESDAQVLQQWVATLHQWVDMLHMPRLAAYHISDLFKVASHIGSIQNNPVSLNHQDLIHLLKQRA